ncbi:putative nucleic acid-binding Zn ribbon protein [Kibdelosporangium banguiense]|uniref:Nucleic acid-binding Zn ribbon protein n=1 Tax=Kibdelosporangium banguiense TaxID=1365924 RepID=A0ABS4TBP5_9PSEU|nr:DciA family protein [Kibdelosporangium banguiense]MBP2321840.1 putative nucleic acid-binding Zn ribbon protein [Kibdelosporangium banguiense]
MRGSDLARAALQAAKDAAGTRERRNNPKGRAPHTGSRKRRRWSAAGADSRDPQKFGAILGKIAADRGWSEQLAHGEVFGRWTAIVGAEIAEHATPLQLRDGELTVQASSTAWATQLRLLQRQLLAKIAKGVGNGVVKRLKVHGPAAPSWRYGPRHVSGRGPRDTYG